MLFDIELLPHDGTHVFSKKMINLCQLNYLLYRTGELPLTLFEAKLLMFILSKVEQEDSRVFEIRFNSADFLKICNDDFADGFAYDYLKNAIDELRKKGLWFYETDKTTRTKLKRYAGIFMRGCVIGPEDNNLIECIIELDPSLAPTLLQLKNSFTTLPLNTMMAYKSIYALLLYQLLISFEWMKHPIILSLRELRELFIIGDYQYENNAMLIELVVKNPIAEINQIHKDIQITYEVIYTGKELSHLAFYITRLSGECTPCSEIDWISHTNFLF